MSSLPSWLPWSHNLCLQHEWQNIDKARNWAELSEIKILFTSMSWSEVNNAMNCAKSEVTTSPLSARQPYTRGRAPCSRDVRSPPHSFPVSQFSLFLPAFPLSSSPIPTRLNQPPIFSCLPTSSSPDLCRAAADHCQARGERLILISAGYELVLSG